MKLQIRSDRTGSGRAGKLNAPMMGGRFSGMLVDVNLLLRRQRVSWRTVHIGNNATRSGIAVYKRLVALVLDHFPNLIQNRRAKNLVQTAIGQGRILVKLRPFLNAPLYAARNAKHKSDDTFRFGIQELRVHLIRRPVKPRHGTDSTGVCARVQSRLLDFFRCKHLCHLQFYESLFHNRPAIIAFPRPQQEIRRYVAVSKNMGIQQLAVIRFQQA